MATRIGLNINGQVLTADDRNRIRRFLQVANPTLTVVMHDFGFAVELKNILRDYHVNPGIVCYRDYNMGGSGDQDFWRNWETQRVVDFYNNHANAGDKDIWIYLMNEPVPRVNEHQLLADRSLDYTMNLNAHGFRVIVGNYPIGAIPDVESYKYAEVVRYCALNPDKAILGTHEYGVGIVPFMFHRERGGKYFPMEDLITRAADIAIAPNHLFPTREDIRAACLGIDAATGSQHNTWHLGATWRLLNAMKVKYPQTPYPRIAVTECFHDRMPDLSLAERAFSVNRNGETFTGHIFDQWEHWWGTGGYSEIKGHRTYSDYWQDIFGVGIDDAMFLQTDWWDKNAPPEYMGAAIFTASRATDWDNQYGHNILHEQRWFELTEQAAVTPTEPDPDDDVDDTIPTNPVWKSFVVVGLQFPNSLYVNVRDAASIKTGNVIGRIAVGDVIGITDKIIYDIDGYDWTIVNLSNGVIGYAADIYIVEPENTLPFTLAEVESAIATLQKVYTWMKE